MITKVVTKFKSKLKMSKLNAPILILSRNLIKVALS